MGYKPLLPGVLYPISYICLSFQIVHSQDISLGVVVGQFPPAASRGGNGGVFHPDTRIRPVKLSSKLKALELLGKTMGLFDGNPGKSLPTVQILEDIHS